MGTLVVINECAKRRSVCVALSLFNRYLLMKVGAVIFTGDLNEAFELETLAL